MAIAGGWPEAIRVDRYVRGQGDDESAAAALAGFERFPSWMWRNSDVAAFGEWTPETIEELLTTHQAPVYVVHFTQAEALERARAQVAGVLGCHPDEIVFRIGGTTNASIGRPGACMTAVATGSAPVLAQCSTTAPARVRGSRNAPSSDHASTERTWAGCRLPRRARRTSPVSGSVVENGPTTVPEAEFSGTLLPASALAALATAQPATQTATQSITELRTWSATTRSARSAITIAASVCFAVLTATSEAVGVSAGLGSDAGLWGGTGSLIA